MTFNPSSCDPGSSSCSVKMSITVAPDAPAMSQPTLVQLTGRSATCDLEKSKVMLYRTLSTVPTIDLTIDGKGGTVHYSHNTQGDLVATVKVAQGRAFEGLLEWDSRDTVGEPKCTATQAAGAGFEGDREANGSEVGRFTGDDTFTISCRDTNAEFDDSVEVRIILDPVFEEF